ncbi:MAG: penicillin acylase family protein [Planctomycetota bacterium]
MRRALALAATLLAVGAAGCGDEAAAAPPGSAEILWDDHGVPHVFAPNEEALFRAFGWAQARAHGELLLQLLGQSRGRAAELWGESFWESDRWVHTRGIPARARAWYDAQTPDFRRNLDAFAAGVNAFAREHPDALAARYRAALPVTGVDLLAHQQRVLHFSFLGDGSATAGEGPGSYGWAVAPGRTAAGHALLMANPHLPWADQHLFFEAHLSMPGLDLYGASLVGFPVLGIAFTEELGWTHTFNTLDGVDLYALELSGDGYLWEGAVRPFEEERIPLRVRRGADEYEERELLVRRSVHGPLLPRAPGNPGALALRVAGLDRGRALEQWWRMARARDLAEFEAALRLQQLPLFTVIYADRAGNVLHAFGGHAPVRPEGELDWRRPVPGTTAATLWTELHPYDALPRVANPPSGWVQNGNDPPWTATLPRELDAEDFPADLAPRFLHHQAQRSLRLLRDDASISFDELVSYKLSTHVELADRLVEAVAEAGRASGTAAAERGAQVLAGWDRGVAAESRGAVLFLTLLHEFKSGEAVFAQPWDEARPLATPAGLADPARAADALTAAVESVEERYGRADVAWGEVFRLRSLDGSGDVDLPCSGGMRALGVMRSFDFAPDEDGRFYAGGGDSFVALVEFGTPVRAKVALVYGNGSQAGVPHDSEALERAARGELRDALRERAEIEARLERREWVAPEEGT